MAKHRKKNYYAVVQGHIAPAICASWGITQPLVSGSSKNEFKGFIILYDTVSFMEEKGHLSYQYFWDSAEDERAPRKGEKAYYAVANGKHTGVYEDYQVGATEHSHSCHKAFRSREEAEGFIKEHRIAADLVKRESPDEDISTTLNEPSMKKVREENLFHHDCYFISQLYDLDWVLRKDTVVSVK